MSNPEKMPIQLNIFNGSKDNIVNGFYSEYCIDSWGKSNTLMLMNLFKDYNYNITVRKHELPPS